MKLNIKRNNLVFVLFLAISSLLSCKDELKDEFYDPEKQTQPSFEMLFAGALQPTELFRLEYGPGYHYTRAFNRMLGLGSFPGTAVGYNGRQENSIKVNTGWSGVLIRNFMFNKTFVDFNKNIPVMNLLLNGMSTEDKENYKIYVLCVNIVKAYMFQRLTDTYDDVPFSEAGGAYQNKFWAKYESQRDIYHALLDMLKDISTQLKGYTLNNSLAHQNFKIYDILNNGEVSKWEKFANSLRLRMAIRLSIIEPETSKQIISDIIVNNSPLITESQDFIGLAEKDYAHVMEYYWPRAFSEVFAYYTAPRFLVHDVFGYNGESTPSGQIDPRLYVIFQPSAFGKYVGLKEWGSEQDTYIKLAFPLEEYGDSIQKVAINWAYDDHLEPYFSMYNKITYNNFDLKYPVFTPTECHLLLAEAALRFPEITGNIDPVTEYRQAISQSIDWWYDVNNTNSFSTSTTPAIPEKIISGSKYPKPNNSVIETFLDNKSNLFNTLSSSDKIKEIFYQKFAHLNVFNYWEIWSESRRLQKDYGILVPKSAIVAWMERLEYPADEPVANPDNYKAVASQDNVTTPVWWTGRKQ